MKKIWPLFLLPAIAAAAEAPINDSGNTAWMLTSTTLVLLMVPGLAMFYGGLVRTKNALSTMMYSFAALAIIGVLWAAVGYSLAFGKNVLGGFIGWSGNDFFLDGLDDNITTSNVPEYIFAMFQGKFAIITPAIISGAVVERIKFSTWCVFIVLWSVIVYSPICHWAWATDGYFYNLGAKGLIDFAGGTVVEISSGVSALVLALYIGRRRGYPQNTTNPNNLVMTLMGAGLLWVGWFGFNAGSAVSSGLETARALTMTQIAGASGALGWMIIEAIVYRKATSLGMVSGILAGLVAITPAAGVVKPYGAVILGALASLCSYTVINIKNRLHCDDTLDVFGIHGAAGIIGTLFLSFFIRDSWMADAVARVPGWNVWLQFGVQAKAAGITILVAGTGTLLIAIILEKTIGFRISEKYEMAGLDQSLHGEHGYGLINLN